ncbi:MAG: GNAT family N-acetyltransferase [Faecousia sp.]
MENQYEELRGRGIGRRLMDAAKAWAKAQGAEKLYISAHSAVESQAFYKAMGCREAEEYSSAAVELEPFDCQLEVSV